MDVLPVRASPDSVMAVPTTVAASDGGDTREAPPQEAAPEPSPAVVEAAQVFSACRETRIVGCDAVYVRMLASDPDLCVQLVMDNCVENARQGLGVLLPLSWRLTSGSVSTDRACDLRDYDPKSQPALAASGKISWAQRGRVISGIEIDVDLRVEAPAGSKVPAEIALATASPIATVDSCVD